MRLIEFVHHYDMHLEATRSSDLEETFRCKNGVPSLARRSTKLLYHAAELYSRNVYNLFERELTASMTFQIVEVDTNEATQTFKLSKEHRDTIYVVKKLNKKVSKRAEDEQNDHQYDDRPILDPPCAKTKGMRNERWKSTVEKLNKKVSKRAAVSSCEKLGNVNQQKRRSSKDQVASKKTCTRISTMPVSHHQSFPSPNLILKPYPVYHAQCQVYSSNSFAQHVSTHQPGSIAFYQPSSSFTSMLLGQAEKAGTNTSEFRLESSSP